MFGDAFLETLHALQKLQPCYQGDEYIGCQSCNCEYAVDGCYGIECAIELIEARCMYDFRENM